VQVYRTEADSFTIGSAAECDLVEVGLDPVACEVYLAEGGYYALESSGDIDVNGRRGSGYLQDGGTLTLGGWLGFRVAVDEGAPAPGVAPAAGPEAPPATAPGATAHRPALAVFFSVLAGAGQAYNGRPLKGALFLVTSILVVPWIWAFVDAHREASRIVAGGGRTGRGGVLWVLLHGWLALNVALTAALALTVSGVLA
jgi:hypothetical protein